MPTTSVTPGSRVHPDLDLLAQRHQLIDGRRAVHVGRHQERRLLLQLEPPGQLARGGRLARALQPDQQDDRRRHRGEGDRRLLFAEQRHQLVVDDLDELLARPHRLERPAGPDRLLLHPLEKLAGQVEADVGFEQDPPNFPEPLLDRLLGQDPRPVSFWSAAESLADSSSNISPAF